MGTGNRKNGLSEKDHKNMDAFIGYVLDDYKAGTLPKDHAISVLAHVIAAIDKGNVGEAQNWFEQGRKLIHYDLPPKQT